MISLVCKLTIKWSQNYFDSESAILFFSKSNILSCFADCNGSFADLDVISCGCNPSSRVSNIWNKILQGRVLEGHNLLKLSPHFTIASQFSLLKFAITCPVLWKSNRVAMLGFWRSALWTNHKAILTYVIWSSKPSLKVFNVSWVLLRSYCSEPPKSLSNRDLFLPQ